MAHSVTDLFTRARESDEMRHKEIIPLKRALNKQDDRIKELEKQLAVAKVRAENAEKIVTDPLLLAEHVCKETRVAEVFLSAVSRTPVEDDLMYTYGTWAFNGGWKAMQAGLSRIIDHRPTQAIGDQPPVAHVFDGAGCLSMDQSILTLHHDERYYPAGMPYRSGEMRSSEIERKQGRRNEERNLSLRTRGKTSHEIS
nr:uncharacterized protein LOC109164808 [Ipomoea batatas]